MAGELRDMYSCASVAFVGGSLIPGLAGHNLAEAARASCAVITGQNCGWGDGGVWRWSILHIESCVWDGVQGSMWGTFRLWLTTCRAYHRAPFGR